MGYREDLQGLVAEKEKEKDLAVAAYDLNQSTENYENLMIAIKAYKKALKDLRSWS